MPLVIQTRVRVMLARCKFIPMLICHRRVVAEFLSKAIRQHLAKRNLEQCRKYRLNVAQRGYKGAGGTRDYTRFRLFLQLRRTTNAPIVLQSWVRQRRQMQNYFKYVGRQDPMDVSRVQVEPVTASEKLNTSTN